MSVLSNFANMVLGGNQDQPALPQVADVVVVVRLGHFVSSPMPC